MTVVRFATHRDARRVAEVHVGSWRAGYRGVLSDHALDEVSVESRLPWWEHALGEGIDGFHVLVVEGDAGHIQGFGSACCSDGDPDWVGEIAQLYLAPEAWGAGLAAPLLTELEADLRARGFELAELHVAPANLRARRFYERSGWRDTGVEHREVVWDIESVTTTYRRAL